MLGIDTNVLIRYLVRDDQVQYDSARRLMAFKKKWSTTLRPPKTPSAAMAEKLSRRLWEFSEQVRLEALSREEGRRRPRA